MPPPTATTDVAAQLARTPFRPAWWARGGLLQTVAAMRSPVPAPAWTTEVWPAPDGDDLRVHFAASAADGDAAPLVVLLHGLEGSRHSAYARAMANGAAARGWRTAVLEFRSCGGVLNRARRTYHSGETTDTALVVARLAARFPRAPLCAIGYSLGANVLLKWLGEVGDAAPPSLLAAAAVSCPYELAVCASQCDARYGGAIARHFLRTLVPKALAKAEQFPGYCDVAAVRACRTFRAFDDLVTAPVHGFRDADHYYATQSSAQFLPAIRRPTLLVSALDDPLCRPEVLPHAAVAASPFLTAQFPAHGGHVGFVHGGAPWRPRRWVEEQALRFFALQLAAV
jgi:predicted alpha/beta-fold hydrolase